MNRTLTWLTGSVAGATASLIAWLNPFLGQVQTTFFADNQFAWISAHSQAVSTVEMAAMEAWLLQEFGPFTPFPATPVPTTVTDIWYAGALKDVGPQGLIQLRTTKAAGWSWEQSWGPLNLRNFVHAELLAFVQQARNRGRIFPMTHPLVPGSGTRPNGLGTSGIKIDGAGQLVGADEIVTDGWPNVVSVVAAGDALKIAGDSAVYIVTEAEISGGTGIATIQITPPLRISPPDDAGVTTTGVEFRVTIENRSQDEPWRPPLYHDGLNLTLTEALV